MKNYSTKLLQTATQKTIFVVAICNKIDMTQFSDNIRFLRTQKGFSKQKLADALEIKAAAYTTYEDGRTEPPFSVLQRIARYYHISVDLLLSVDIRKVNIEKLLTLEDNRIVLPITVDKNGENLIEIVPHKAKAGYLAGYSDPEYIESLQHISLPFLRNGKFRAFPNEGKSMPPFQDGSFIVGQYVEKAENIKDGHTYVMLTKDDGIVYKRVYRKGRKFMFHSDNPEFEPYEVKTTDILEVWKFAFALISKEYQPDDIPQDSMRDLLLDIKRDIKKLVSGNS